MKNIIELNQQTINFIKDGPEDNIILALQEAGISIENLMKAAAGVVSGIITLVAGLVLLITVIKCLWKTWKGNDNEVWSDAATTLFASMTFLAISGAITAYFFL